MQYKPQDAQFAETLQDKFVVLLALVYGVISHDRLFKSWDGVDEENWRISSVGDAMEQVGIVFVVFVWGCCSI